MNLCYLFLRGRGFPPFAYPRHLTFFLAHMLVCLYVCVCGTSWVSGSCEQSYSMFLCPHSHVRGHNGLAHTVKTCLMPVTINIPAALTVMRITTIVRRKMGVKATLETGLWVLAASAPVLCVGLDHCIVIRVCAYFLYLVRFI